MSTEKEESIIQVNYTKFLEGNAEMIEDDISIKDFRILEEKFYEELNIELM
jgi:hypothetical protein